MICSFLTDWYQSCPGAWPWGTDGQPLPTVACWFLLGQHHRAGQTDQLPWHYDIVWTIPTWLEHVVHQPRTRECSLAWYVKNTSVVLHVYDVVWFAALTIWSKSYLLAKCMHKTIPWFNCWWPNQELTLFHENQLFSSNLPNFYLLVGTCQIVLEQF